MTSGEATSRHYDVEQVELQEQPTAVVRDTIQMDAIASFLGHAFSSTAQVIGAAGVGMAGPPFARYRFREGAVEVEAGFPVDHAITASADVVPSRLPGGTIARVMHRGPYDELGGAYEAVQGWLAAHGHQGSGDPWESYLDEPDVAEPRTVVDQPFTDAAPADRPGR